MVLNTDSANYIWMNQQKNTKSYSWNDFYFCYLGLFLVLLYFSSFCDKVNVVCSLSNLFSPYKHNVYEYEWVFHSLDQSNSILSLSDFSFETKYARILNVMFFGESFFAKALLFLLSVCYSCLSMFEPKNLRIYLPRTTWSPFPVCAHVGRPEVGNDAPNAQQQKRRRCYFLIRDLNWQIFKDPFNYNVCFLFSLPCFVSALKSLNLRIFFK
jgi:hypothetical protein